MAIINGHRWFLQLVGFAPLGRGYFSERLDHFPSVGKKGRPSGQQIKSWAVDVWGVNPMHSLFGGCELLYIGEGVMNEQLQAHCRDDEFTGRWVSFTWSSPSILDTTKTEFEIKPYDAKSSFTSTQKEQIEAFELLAIRLGDPWGNRQNPTDDDRIRWIKQIRSKLTRPRMWLSWAVNCIAIGDKVCY